MKRDKFLIDKALGWGLGVSFLTLILIAPVMCGTTEFGGGRAGTRCEGLVPLTTTWVASGVVAVVAGVAASMAYVVLRGLTARLLSTEGRRDHADAVDLEGDAKPP